MRRQQGERSKGEADRWGGGHPFDRRLTAFLLSAPAPTHTRGNRFLFDYQEDMDPELQEVGGDEMAGTGGPWMAMSDLPTGCVWSQQHTTHPAHPPPNHHPNNSTPPDPNPQPQPYTTITQGV